VLIPHTTNSTSYVTLDVNDFGEKPLFRPSLSGGASVGEGTLKINQPYRVIYDRNSWLLCDYPKPLASDLSGVVPVDKGGVPTATTSNSGQVLTVDENGTPAWGDAPEGESNKVGINEIGWIYTGFSTVSDIEPSESGVHWAEPFAVTDAVEGDEVYRANIRLRVPIVAGNNVTFEEDEENQVVKINALGGSALNDITQIDLWYGEKTSVSTNGSEGISWQEEFAFLDENDSVLQLGETYNRIPIMAGTNITFEEDERNQVIKINSTGVSKEYVDNLFANIANGDEVAY
jgi:hypothetical protein